ncbi:MAG: glutamate dehydrogenase, partial [Elusimicrobiaceae bacterium]|nr:glutamate dehydrogenase [Elusimicrobiaceae bacterium]
IKEYAEKYASATFFPGKKAWHIKCDAAFPTSHENELEEEDAKALIANGCFCISEGSNMPSVPAAVELFVKEKILYGPGKAANAGGVAVSGLEMSQNSMRYSWSREEVDTKLKDIMNKIHTACVVAAKEYGVEGNYVDGANIAGFKKVAEAMLQQGIV